MSLAQAEEEGSSGRKSGLDWYEVSVYVERSLRFRLQGENVLDILWGLK